MAPPKSKPAAAAAAAAVVPLPLIVAAIPTMTPVECAFYKRAQDELIDALRSRYDAGESMAPHVTEKSAVRAYILQMHQLVVTFLTQGDGVLALDSSLTTLMYFDMLCLIPPTFNFGDTFSANDVPLGDEGIAIALRLACRPSVTTVRRVALRLTPWGATFSPACPTPQLSLANTEGTRASAIRLGTFFQTHKHITTFDISSVRLTKGSSKPLSMLLPIISATAVQTLTLTDVGLTKFNCMMLSELLRNNTLHCATLDVSCNNLSTASAIILLMGLMTNTTVTKLDIGTNGLTDECLQAVAALITHNKGLHTLIVFNNEFTIPAMAVLVPALDRNPLLQKLVIGNDEQEPSEICAVFKDRQSAVEITGEDCVD